MWNAGSDAIGSTVITSVLPTLVLLYWILAIFAAVVSLLPLPYIDTFRNAVILSACRGKLMENKPRASLGILTDWTVPQRWFYHFYLVGCVWNGVVTLLFIFSPTNNKTMPPLLLIAHALSLVLFEIHLIRRLAETLGMMNYPVHARMHGIAWIFGLSYYIVVPLTLIPKQAYKSVVADYPYKAMLPLEHIALRSTFTVEMFDLIQYMGILIFLLASALQFQSHYLLAKPLQRKRRTSSGNVYRIPRGGAFELVSCPHYLAEILIYTGLAFILGKFSVISWLPLLWVMANLSLAAGLTHEWYLQKFKTYPRKRKALFPYLY